MKIIKILSQWKHWWKKTSKQCDYNKSLQSKNNKWTVNQWANSQRTSLISIAAATSTQSHKGVVLLTVLPCRGWEHTSRNWSQRILTHTASPLAFFESLNIEVDSKLRSDKTINRNSMQSLWKQKHFAVHVFICFLLCGYWDKCESSHPHNYLWAVGSLPFIW